MKMTKNELIANMAEKSELTKKDSEKALNAFISSISEELKKGGKIQIVGFGTFEVSKRKERTGKNPKTGEMIVIPASCGVKFKAGKQLKDYCN